MLRISVDKVKGHGLDVESDIHGFLYGKIATIREQNQLIQLAGLLETPESISNPMEMIRLTEGIRSLIPCLHTTKGTPCVRWNRIRNVEFWQRDTICRGSTRTETTGPHHVGLIHLFGRRKQLFPKRLGTETHSKPRVSYPRYHGARNLNQRMERSDQIP